MLQPAPREQRARLQELVAALRDAFWRYVEESAAAAPAVKGVRRRGATWIRAGVRAEVQPLRGEETLRHATLQDLQIEQ